MCVLQAGYELFFDDSDEESDYGQPKVENYVEQMIPRMTTHQFKRHFRMHINVFEITLGYLHEMETATVNPGHPE